MRAEIDLPNPGGKILPGMYAYGKIVVERPDVRALPKSALTHAGGKSFIWRYKDGKAERTEIQTGLMDDEWVEVTNRRVKTDSDDDHWVPIEPAEAVLTGSELSTLTEGDPVRLADAPAPEGGGSARASSEATGAG